jgi:hypothetical protein
MINRSVEVGGGRTMRHRNERTDVRVKSPFDVGNRPNGQSPSYIQVVAYGTVAGAVALVAGQAVGNALFAQYNVARTIVLATVAILVGAAAGAACDPILSSLNRRRGNS